MDDLDLDPKELLLKTHRKEKKDLQAKIQVLKKTASKGDKKKKKDVAEEIASLEAELVLKHKNELSNFDESTPKLENNEVCTNGETKDEQNDSEEETELTSSSGQRVSKAQKRRDKKAAKEKERLKEIEIQEEENKHGSRNREAEKIKSILNSRKLIIKEIPSNGDCMFEGLVHQLSLVNVKITGKQLRNKATDEIRANSQEYLPFLSNCQGDMMNENEFNKYCDDMENTSAWGGQVELRALSQALKVAIEVVQADGPSIIVGQEFAKHDEGREGQLILTYHRHAYGLGEHYNSVVGMA